MKHRKESAAGSAEAKGSLERAMELARSIQGSFQGADIAVQPSTNFCVRPKKQLFDTKRALVKAYGEDFMRINGIIPRTQPSITRSDEAHALFYASARSLEDRSHRFTFFIDGTVAYHQEPFNTDCQAIPSRKIDLSTLQEIAGNDNAMVELEWLANELRGVDPASWQPRPDLGRIPITNC